MIRFRPLLVMTVLCVLALALLVGLGRWQWERYEQKMAAAAEPVPERTIAGYQPIPDGLQFVFGRRPDTRELGWRVFAPVQHGDQVVFIDADFVPGVESPRFEEVRFPAALRFGAPVGGASIEPRAPGPFAIPPRLLERRWYAIDLQRMGRIAGLENVAEYYIAGDYVGADGRAVDNPFAVSPDADPMSPTRHLGYAITWYGLALVLLAIYFAYHISVGRLSFRPPRPPEG